MQLLHLNSLLEVVKKEKQLTIGRPFQPSYLTSPCCFYIRRLVKRDAILK